MEDLSHAQTRKILGCWSNCSRDGAVASFAAGEFEGTWNVKDTAGKAFQITLAVDGSAKADREGEGMTGTWKQEGSAAVITWNTGWTTKISEQDGKFTKMAFKKRRLVEW